MKPAKPKRGVFGRPIRCGAGVPTGRAVSEGVSYTISLVRVCVYIVDVGSTSKHIRTVFAICKYSVLSRSVSNTVVRENQEEACILET